MENEEQELQLLDEEDIIHKDFPSVIHVVHKKQAPTGEVLEMDDIYVQGEDMEECWEYYTRAKNDK